MPARPKASRPRYTASEQELIVKFLAALGEPNRLKILTKLFDGPCTVTELVAVVSSKMPTVSRHLAILKEAGLVKAQYSHRHVLHSVTGTFPRELMDLVLRQMREHQETRERAML